MSPSNIVRRASCQPPEGSVRFLSNTSSMETMATAAALPASDRDGAALFHRLRAAFEANALVVTGIAVCAGLQASLIRTAIKSDTWLSLLAGRLVAHHGLPHKDTLDAITAGRRWVDQQWLAHLTLYGLWAAGRWPLALLAGVVVLAGSFA